MKILLRCVLTYTLLTNAWSADKLIKHVVSVKHTSIVFSFPPKLRQQQATGICIDVICSVIAVPYHAQAMVGRGNLEPAGARTKKVLSLANESDTNKSELRALNTTLSLDPTHDISFIYADKPVAHKFPPAFRYNCAVGETVEIVGYLRGKLTKRRATVIGINMHLDIGEAELNENLLLDTTLEPGFSGSGVFDEQGKLLGMVTMTGTLISDIGEAQASFALPTRAIAGALVKLDPALGRSRFGEIPDSEIVGTPQKNYAYKTTNPSEPASSLIPPLHPAPISIPDADDQLRSKARIAARQMTNLIAEECLAQGGKKAVCYEVLVYEGNQMFRQIKNGAASAKELDHAPVVRRGIWSESDWLYTYYDVETEGWVFEGSLGDKFLFTLRSRAHDENCAFTEYGNGRSSLGYPKPVFWHGSVDCFEQIVTDKDFNIVATYAQSLPPEPCMTEEFQRAIEYDWVTLDGSRPPLLVPIKETLIAKARGQERLRYAQLTWSHYKQFTSEHTITVGEIR